MPGSTPRSRIELIRSSPVADADLMFRELLGAERASPDARRPEVNRPS